MLALYRDLLALRRAEPALAVGSYRTIEVTDDTLCFERRQGPRALSVALNFTDRPQLWPPRPRTLLSTVPSGTELELLAPNEGRIEVE